MTHPNEDLARGASEALAKGDMETFLDFHSDDVVVRVQGRNPSAGEFRGREEILRSAEQLTSLLDEPPTWETHDVMAGDDHAIVLGTQRFVRGGKTLEDHQVVIAHIREGKANEIWVCSTDPYAVDEFFA
ncbi:MAG TPA: nuclear transport factor 2 family protein [Actinomycetota bacterium]|nr:nuclear transport factor 2 family protein [Actinomycetota bacterium]